MPVILATLGPEVGKIMVRDQLRQIVQRLHLSKKKIKAIWTGGVAQVIECLLCKYKALRSNPSPTKKRRKNGARKTRHPYTKD
jgi:hypothetical protein